MKNILFLVLLAGLQGVSAQNHTRRDSLQGGLRIERTSYDVLRYDLDIKIDPKQKSIVGFNEITFKVVDNTSRIQVDLFANMAIDSIVANGKRLNAKREFDAVFIDFPAPLVRVASSGSGFIIREIRWWPNRPLGTAALSLARTTTAKTGLPWRYKAPARAFGIRARIRRPTSPTTAPRSKWRYPTAW
jgi:hypothetical protein